MKNKIINYKILLALLSITIPSFCSQDITPINISDALRLSSQLSNDNTYLYSLLDNEFEKKSEEVIFNNNNNDREYFDDFYDEKEYEVLFDNSKNMEIDKPKILSNSINFSVDNQVPEINAPKKLSKDQHYRKKLKIRDALHDLRKKNPRTEQDIQLIHAYELELKRSDFRNRKNRLNKQNELLSLNQQEQSTKKNSQMININDNNQSDKKISDSDYIYIGDKRNFKTMNESTSDESDEKNL